MNHPFAASIAVLALAASAGCASSGVELQRGRAVANIGTGATEEPTGSRQETTRGGAPEDRGARSIDLSVTSLDDTRLAGTLHRPADSDAFPVVVFSHGSEPGKRGQYARWARAFLDRGIAALVFDKRGCGESAGKYVEAPDLAVPAEDLIAWVERVSEMEEVDSVGVLGWSQGGWVGPLAASRCEQIDYVVSISGPGVSPLEQNIHHKTRLCAATGATPGQVEVFERTIRQVWTYFATGEGQAEAREAWAAVFSQQWFADAYEGAPMMDRDILLRHPSMQHYVAHSRYDPGPALRSIEVPMLAVFGEADIVVPVDASVAAMREAFDRPDGHLTLRVIPGADHGLRIDSEFAGGVPESVVAWVAERVFSPPTEDDGNASGTTRRR